MIQASIVWNIYTGLKSINRLRKSQSWVEITLIESYSAETTVIRILLKNTHTHVAYHRKLYTAITIVESVSEVHERNQIDRVKFPRITRIPNTRSRTRGKKRKRGERKKKIEKYAS